MNNGGGEPTDAGTASLTAEERRLQEARAGVPWRAWGPYLSERQWGTVREDYSENGDAWSYFTHDQARSRAYRWGEDGIAGISDDKQRLCLALALWNERDPILKERLFGLTNGEGNHGEDVKEYYFYVDNLPTHSYQRVLYKYPQAEYPYNDLVAANRARSRHELRVRAHRHRHLRRGALLRRRGGVREGRPGRHRVPGHRAQSLHRRMPRSTCCRTLWFRNTWSWADDQPRPRLSRVESADPVVRAEHHELGVYYLHAEPDAALLFCENETNAARVWGAATATAVPEGRDRRSPAVRRGRPSTPTASGTKAAAHVALRYPAAGRQRCWCA